MKKYQKIQEVTKDLGAVYNTLNYGSILILEWHNAHKILVQFLNTGFTKYVQRNSIELGVIRDNSVANFGIGKSANVRTTDDNNKMLREYALWRNMLRRCYSDEFHVKWRSYKDCTVSDNFKDFKYSSDWCKQQTGFHEVCWQLDKDFIIAGNKEYSEHTCVFLPQELNMFVVKNTSRRGDYPIGVSFEKSRNKYVAGFCNSTGTRNNLGRFDTVEEAFNTYKMAKELQARDFAIKYRGIVDNRVIEVLNNYTVNIDD